MKEFFFDQLDRKVNVTNSPKRIISLVPSITELIIDLGLEKALVGRTKFCVHPKSKLQPIFMVGGTKQIHFDRIAALKPDLIIANKEENDKAQIEQLAKDYPVWISDIADFEAALGMIKDLGEVLRKEAQCLAIIRQSREFIAQLKATKPRKVAYLIWRNPYMTIGKDTYIHDMLRLTGFENVYGEYTRYPTFTVADLQKRQPDMLLLSSEPFPFKQKHIAELAADFPNIPIVLVDGEAFSWYGTRFLKTFNYLKNL